MIDQRVGLRDWPPIPWHNLRGLPKCLLNVCALNSPPCPPSQRPRRRSHCLDKHARQGLVCAERSYRQGQGSKVPRDVLLTLCPTSQLGYMGRVEDKSQPKHVKGYAHARSHNNTGCAMVVACLQAAVLQSSTCCCCLRPRWGPSPCVCQALDSDAGPPCPCCLLSQHT